jgi:N-acetylglucosamine kinase-like BadF-type ATPase
MPAAGGHILGDTGGGYFLSIQALRLLLREYDLSRRDNFAAKSCTRFVE